MKFMKIILISGILVLQTGLLVGCSDGDPRYSLMETPKVGKSMFSPRNMFMRNLPDGNDGYSVGFRDGCDTYMAIIGTGLVQFKPFQQDNTRMLNDPNYNKGYVDGRNYCTYTWHPAVN